MLWGLAIFKKKQLSPGIQKTISCSVSFFFKFSQIYMFYQLRKKLGEIRGRAISAAVYAACQKK